jgi:LacI family transcriptional regulator
LADVATLAQVSPATASRVLNGSRSVGPGLRARVERAMASLDYRPHRVARSLRRGASSTIGLVLHDVQNPFFSVVLRGVEQVAVHHDYLVMICNSDQDPAREQMYADALIAELVGGVVLASTDPLGHALSALVAAGVPVVLIDRHSGKAADLVDTVFVDNFAGGYAAARHLVSLGHRRLAAISGPVTVNVATERLAGFEAGLGAAGLHLDPAMVRAGDFKQASGVAQMQSLLASHGAQLDAVFVANDLMTLGALEAIHAAGLRIPGDVSVVGFDDMPWAASLNPPLTTVGQPGVEMGEIACRLLLERLGQHRTAPPRHVLLQPQLVVRSSTGPARRPASLGKECR